MAKDTSPMRAIAERSINQLGLVTTDQLSGLGLTRQEQRTLEARGRLERLGVRVWRLPGHPVTWHQRLLAAVLEAGPDAVVSHLAACAWCRFEGIAPGAVEITVPRTQRPRRVEGSSTARVTCWPWTSTATAPCRSRRRAAR